MKKYHVKDADGEEFEVTEIDSDTDETVETEPMKTDDEATLTAEEITALKGLAAAAPKLMKLVEGTQDDCGAGTEDKDPDEMADEDPDEVQDDEEIEEVIDTDETSGKKTTDSIAKSVGALEKKKKSKDSMTGSLDIESAWAKRYGGN